MPTRGIGGRFTYAERALAEELAIEIATTARELLTFSDRWDDTTTLAVLRERDVQTASAKRLRALFTPDKQAA